MKKLYDVYFKPAMCGVITIEAENEKEAMKIVEEKNELMTPREKLERIANAMEVDGYELEIIGCEYLDDVDED